MGAAHLYLILAFRKLRLADLLVGSCPGVHSKFQGYTVRSCLKSSKRGNLEGVCVGEGYMSIKAVSIM